MGITRLKRKARRNKQTAAKRQVKMQQLNRQPVVKNIDAEAAKASFGTAPEKVAEAPAPAAEEVKAEAVVEETPVAEATEEVVEEAVADTTEDNAEAEAPAEGEEETKEEA